MHLTTQQKGLLNSITFAGIIASSFIWGYLADTKGRKKIMIPTLLISFAFTVASSFTGNVWLFFGLRFFSGFFISGPCGTIYAYLGEFHGPSQRSRAIMCAAAVFGLGCLLLPAVAWLVIDHEWFFRIDFLDITYKPWRLYIITCGVPSLLSGIILMYFPESPKFVLSQGKYKEALEILAKIYSINSGKPTQDFPVSAILDEVTENGEIAKPIGTNLTLCQSIWDQTAPLFMLVNLRKTIIGCTLQFGIFATTNGMYMWFPGIINLLAEFRMNNPGKQMLICDVVSASIISSKNDADTVCKDTMEREAFLHSFKLEICFAVGFILIAVIIKHVGKLSVLAVIFFGSGICGVLCVYIDEPVMASYLFLVLMLCGLGTTVVNAAIIDLYPTHLRAMAVCVSLMMGKVGSIIGTNMVGSLIDYNCSATLWLAGGSLIFCGFISFLIPNILSRNKPPPTKEQSTLP